jgi:hypothetical protein
MDQPDYKHPQYETAAPRWQRCRDAVAGQDAVHSAGVRYLPRLSEQTNEDYAAYVKRAPFYPATGRTLSGLVGMVFRKDPHIEVPEAMQPYIEDVTLSGVSIFGLTRQIMSEVQEVGRCGVLVEFPRVSEQPSNLAAALAMNLRPYATLYKAESIINWRVERINNQMRPTLIVLMEQHEERGQFETEYIEQIRVLTLENGFYEVRIYRKGQNGWALVEGFAPMMNGQAMREIPFYIFGPDQLSFDVQTPPMLEMADLNLSHYRTSADLEHGAHFTGLPMLFLSGIQLDEGQTVAIGSQKAIVAPMPDASGKYIEFAGQGLGTLEKLLDRKESQMAAIGARMLAPDKKAAESGVALEMRHSGESSVLASMARLLSGGVQKFLDLMRQWAGIPGEVVFTMNTDYLPVKMTAQELTAMVQAWQAGAISEQTLFFNLQEGEIIASGKTFEEEAEEKAMQGPSLGMIGVETAEAQ